MNVNIISTMPDFTPSDSKVSSQDSSQSNFKDYLDKSTNVSSSNKEVNRDNDSREVKNETTNDSNNSSTKVESSVNDNNQVKSKDDNVTNDDENTTKLKNVLDKLNELKDRLEELQKSSKDDSDLNKTIQQILSLINSLMSKVQDLYNEQKTSGKTEVDALSLLNTADGKSLSITDLLGGQSNQNLLNSNVQATQDNTDLISKINELLEEIKNIPTDNVKTQNSAEDILKLLAGQTDTSSTVNTSVNDVVSKLKEVIKEIPQVLSNVTENNTTKADANKSLNDDKTLASLNNNLQDKTLIQSNVAKQDTNSGNLSGQNPGTEEQKSTSLAATTDISKTSASSSKDTKEDNFLKSIIKGDDGSNFDKLVQQNLNRTLSPIDNAPGAVTSISKENITQDIIKTMKFMQTSGLKELTVKMNPKDLGEVTVKIISQGELMKASINATNKETYDLLNSKVQEIKNVLNTQNIKIDDVNVSLNDNYTSFGSGQGNFEESKGQNGKTYSADSNNESIENIDIPEEELNYNNLNALA